MLKYYLVPSALQKVRGSVARVKVVAAANLDDVIARMTWEHPGLQRAEALRVLHCYFEAVQGLLLDGQSVNTPLEHFRLSIRGIFSSEMDSFRAGRHALVPRVSPSRQLTTLIQRGARLEKIEVDLPRPQVLTYVDVASGVSDDTLSPREPGRVLGRRLKFDPADPEQGVFFVAADGSAARGKFYLIQPGEVILEVPDLAPGRYQLEVRAILNNNRKVRVGRLNETLTVA